MTKQLLLARLAALWALFADPSRAIRLKGVMRISLRDYARVLLPLHKELRHVTSELTHDSG